VIRKPASRSFPRESIAAFENDSLIEGEWEVQELGKPREHQHVCDDDGNEARADGDLDIRPDGNRGAAQHEQDEEENLDDGIEQRGSSTQPVVSRRLVFVGHRSRYL